MNESSVIYSKFVGLSNSLIDLSFLYIANEISSCGEWYCFLLLI